MARKVRIQYPGAIYHVMNRGDRREAIFEDDEERQRLLLTLTEACQKTAWQVRAHCLMRNHSHPVLETPSPNLVAGMQWPPGTHTSRYNRRHKEFGRLFSRRYKALIVDGSGNGYLKTVGDYVHLNPARAKVLKPEQPLSAFGWSSYLQYSAAPSRRSSGLRVDRILGEWGLPKNNAAGRQVPEARMEWRRKEDLRGEFKRVERGWCLGREEFRQELLEQVDPRPGPSHFGEAVQEAEAAQAERLVEKGLKRMGWSESDLSARRKGERAKVQLARELRSKTTMRLAWIAERLNMGSRRHLAWLLQGRRSGRLATARKGMLGFISLTFLLGSLATGNGLMAGDSSRKNSEPILDTAGDHPQPAIWGVATNGLRPVVFIDHYPEGWGLAIGLLPLEQFPPRTWLAITNHVRAKVELWRTNGIQVLSTNADVVNAFQLPKRTAVSEVFKNSSYPRHMRVLQWWGGGESPRSVGRLAPYGTDWWKPESAFKMSPANDYVLKISPLIYKVDTNRVTAQLVEFRPIVIKLMPNGRVQSIEE